MLQSLYYATRILEYQQLERELTGAVLRYRWDSRTSEDIFGLYLGEADMYRRLAEQAVLAQQEPSEVAGDFRLGLLALDRAERLASPAELPSRFRQLALLYPALAAGEDTYRRRASDGRSGAEAAHLRKAAYFRVTLGLLDRIVSGDPSVP